MARKAAKKARRRLRLEEGREEGGSGSGEGREGHRGGRQDRHCERAAAVGRRPPRHEEVAKPRTLVEGYLDVVKAYVMKGAKVKIGDIGMIMIRHRKARMGRNPQTGEPVKIKASKKLAFRQSAVMKATSDGRPLRRSHDAKVT